MWSTFIALGYVWLALTGTAGAALVALMTVQRLLRGGHDSDQRHVTARAPSSAAVEGAVGDPLTSSTSHVAGTLRTT